MALQLSGVSSGFAGSPRVLLQRKRGGKESLGQGEAWEPTPPKSRGKTIMEMQPHIPENPDDNRQFSPLSRVLSPVPLPNHRSEPHTPNFYQDWHRMLATAAGQDQLSPQAPTAGAEEWRQRVGPPISPSSLNERVLSQCY